MKLISPKHALFVFFAFAPNLVLANNPIQTENANPGTSGWQLSNPATNREIEGYASATSVNIGGTINFFVSTSDSSFKLEIFRTGWYAGVGARLLTTVNSIAGQLQTTPAPDPVTGMVECQWTASYTLNVPSTWVSGIFLVRLTGNQSGKQSWIIFVVRDDARTSALLFESSVTTFQAYNFWPNGANGKSLYNFAPGGRAWKVSFNRPYVLGFNYSSQSPGQASGVGAGEYLANLQPGQACCNYGIYNAGFEYNMVRWLEENGYDVTYMTDVDLDENASILTNHKAFLSVGHNEYWSMQMRQNIQNAVANGLNLGNFSANTIYWQIRFEPGFDGTADRTMVCYKYDAASYDPDYNTQPQLATVEWRNSPVNMPESAFIGNEYVADPVESDIVVSNASHWLFNGTGLSNGSHITGLLGYEVDVMVPGTSPSNIQVLASSPFGPISQDYDNPPGFSCNTQVCYANVTWYSAGNAFVFAAGTMQWSWGLDDYNSPSLRPTLSNAAAQQITANVLAAFINPVTVTTTSLPSDSSGAAYSPLQLTASGGGQPYSWAATGLPSGMNVSSAGVLSGTPTQAGNFSVKLTVTDAAQHTGSATLPLVISTSTVYSISGQVTLSGVALSGVTLSLSTGPTTTTNSSGNYVFSSLASGTYTVTPSESGYSFSPSSKTFTNITASQTANFTASVTSSTARAVSINFVGDGNLMASTESAGVVAETNWNQAQGSVSSPILLADATGALNGSTVSYTADNTYVLPITDAPGNVRMMEGYLDNGNQDPTTITISNLPASTTGYDIYVYTDGDNGSAVRTGTYTISGSGITTTSISATDAANTNFSGTFVQASNSSGNYVKFSAVQTTGFTLTATPGTSSDAYERAPVNGIQIIPSPPKTTVARAVSINFVGDGISMASSESAGVVAETNWNQAQSNAGGPMALVDVTGAVNGATVTWTSDNTYSLPITDSPGNVRMMEGYLDDGSGDSTTVTVSGLPTSSTGYDVYLYTDGDNGSAKRIASFAISGTGITTQTIFAVDAKNTNFSGTFTQASGTTASNATAGNYVKFSTINATAFKITATPASSSDGYLRAPVNGMQVVPH